MKKNPEYTNICDCNGELIPYGALLDFIWWAFNGSEVELHYVARIRKRKSGDIFEFIKDDRGRDCYFTHRLSAINWCGDDLELLQNE